MNVNLHQKAKGFFALTICILVLSGCTKKDDSAAGAMQMPPIPVTTKIIEPQNIPIKLEYPASIKSVKKVQITARVAGTLEEKYYTDGEFVKQGAKLYKIDPTRYQAIYDSALASLSMSQASFKEATRNYERSQKLVNSNALSKKDHDAIVSAYEKADAAVKVSEAAVKNAKVDLDNTIVKATIDGVTGLNSIDLGSYVGTSPANSVLTTITQLNPVYAEFSLPDIEFLKNKYILSTGDWNDVAGAKLSVSIITPLGNTYEHNGTLDFFDSSIDPNTASVKARATFTNPENTLIPGLFTRVSIDGLVQKNAFSIPQAALMQDVVGMYVYTVDSNNTVHKVPVKASQTTKDGSFIITEGLSGGENIIISNIIKVGPGRVVSPTASKE